MSACSFQNLVASNPPPNLVPCDPSAPCPTVTSTGYNLTDPRYQIGVLPYSGQASPERLMFASYWNDLVKRHGVRIKYWRHGFDFSNADVLYGEAPTARFRDSELLAGVAELTNNSVTLQRFGFQATNDVKILIPINEFTRVFGATVRPMADDLLTIVDAYSDRPAGFGPRIFQVTYADDEGPDTNQLGGHFMWTLDAIRFEPSSEKGAPDEDLDTSVTHQATEDELIGILPGGTSPASPPKPYSGNADDIATADFDEETRGGGRDDVYGSW